MRLRLIILSDNLAAKVAFCSAAYAFFSRAASLTPPSPPFSPLLSVNVLVCGFFQVALSVSSQAGGSASDLAG